MDSKEHKVDYTENIDCIGILKYLDEYAGKEYCQESRRTDENRLQMRENEAAGKKATNELRKMAELCEKQFNLIKNPANSWLDGSGRRLRSYLWIQLKAPGYENKPESISIFVEKSDIQKTSRFRFSLEISHQKAREISGEIERYHKHLELPINKEKGMVYVAGSDEKGDITLINEPQEEVRKKLQSGEYNKVQISEIIEQTESLTNEECIEKMLQAVEDLLPYYKHVVGNLPNKSGENKMNNNLKVDEFDKNIILYGPPGTGKTYSTAIYAVSICDKRSLEEVKQEDYNKVMKRYKELKEEGRIAFTTFHQSYGYEEFIEGIKPVMNEEDGEEDNDCKLEYTIKPGIFKKFCNDVEIANISERTDTKLNKSPTVNSENKNYVFIIDEINRGNISKIFGELITLIEPSKRIGKEEELKVKLPYSEPEFGVPNNIYILGTMNTADRSIALIDTALRRRFQFIEMMPEEELLKEIKMEKDLNISLMLEKINKRIEVLYDREHTIGHAYFWELKKEPTIEKLATIFENKIIPLLQEYFYEDYSKIQLILGEKIIKKEPVEMGKLFKNNLEEIDLPEYKYIIDKEALREAENYKEIYQ